VSARRGVVVSGASSGIGLATVTLLAQSGYVAFAGVRNEADATRLRELHSNIRPILLEVTDAASIANAAAEVVARGMPLAGVVSNAGIAAGGPLEHLPIEDLRRTLEVNVVGALALVQTLMAYLPAPGGRIVLVGSVAGRLAMPYNAAYSASKFALRAIADALRIELASSGILISLIEPGAVNTPIWRKGRESRAHVVGMLGDGARSHYYRAMESLMRMTETQERDGIPAERVAEAIRHALTAKRPRARYVLGSAKTGNILALLPLRLRDRIIRAVQRI
jgi:NAD(P)-dependent dehydrogenase (short-subunit alcohol dehydrogenase family)